MDRDRLEAIGLDTDEKIIAAATAIDADPYGGGPFGSSDGRIIKAAADELRATEEAKKSDKGGKG